MNKILSLVTISSTCSITSDNLAIGNDINSNLMSTIKNDNEINFLAMADIQAD